MNIKKIVVAVDFNSDSVLTLSQIKCLELPKTAEIHLVHVFELALLSVDFIPVLNPSENDYRMIEQVILKKLDHVKKELHFDEGSNVLIKCLISVGAKQEFLQYVDEINPDLVIAASQEKKGLAGFFEGSFTSFLSKFCRTNLLILRP